MQGRGHECGCIHAPSSSWWSALPWSGQRTTASCRTRQTQRELGQTARNGVVATLLLKPSFTPRRCGGRDESASHVRFLPRSPCARPLPLPTPLPVAPPPAAAARDAAFAQASNTGLDVFGTLGSEPGCDGSSAGRLSAPSGDGGGGDGDDGGGGGDGGGGDGGGRGSNAHTAAALIARMPSQLTTGTSTRDAPSKVSAPACTVAPTVTPCASRRRVSSRALSTHLRPRAPCRGGSAGATHQHDGRGQKGDRLLSTGTREDQRRCSSALQLAFRGHRAHHQHLLPAQRARRQRLWPHPPRRTCEGACSTPPIARCLCRERGVDAPDALQRWADDARCARAQAPWPHQAWRHT
jgi:hypothetical protein